MIFRNNKKKTRKTGIMKARIKKKIFISVPSNIKIKQWMRGLVIEQCRKGLVFKQGRRGLVIT